MHTDHDIDVLGAHSSVPQDVVTGKLIEQHGIDTIPERDRHSSPLTMFWILIGAELTYGVIVTGWLPVALGLGWWSSFSALVIGVALGSLVLAPMALLGPRTGTNGAVSSGAFFGVVGRIVGSALSVFIAIGFYALTVWTGGQAAIAGLHRAFGFPDSNVYLGIAYALMAIFTVAIAIFGHDYMARANKFMIPTSGLILVVAIFVFGSKFDAGFAGGGYALGSFWPTWGLAVTVGASMPISYAPFVNDWSRYVSRSSHSDRKIFVWTMIGSFIGLGFALIIGAYITTTFADPTMAFVPGMIETSPTWFLLPLVLVGLFGTFGQGGLALYGTGLDFSSLFPSLSRVQATILLSAIGVLFIFLGTLVWNVVDSVAAFLLILTVFTTPWLVICLVGLAWRRGFVDASDVQVFNRGEKGGIYWFTNGLNFRALIAWAAGGIVGFLFLNTTVWVGPWANAFGGVDASFTSSAVVSAVVYVVLLLIFKEPRSVYGTSQRA